MSAKRQRNRVCSKRAVLSPVELEARLVPTSLPISGGGELCACAVCTGMATWAAEEQQATGTLTAVANPTASDASQTFKLHSNPTANHVIYLDFDGNTTTNTYWNTYFGKPSFTTPAANLSPAQIEDIWRRVAEDFAPFNVDVTTEDPGLERIRKTSSADTQWGVRVAIGGSSYDWYGGGAGGVGFVGSFNWNMDNTVFVFPQQIQNNVKYISEAASHEVGHSLGLSHDGQLPSTGYYYGHGGGPTGWAPIMGASYFKELSQWSKGDYGGANNLEDDLQIITTQNGFGYRVDDHSNLGPTATAAAVSGNTISGKGIIERNTDVDVFWFDAGAGKANLFITPSVGGGSNLDVLAQLYDSAGNLIASANPAGTLVVSFDVTLAAGRYFLTVDGGGQEGSHSDYGSLGQYQFTGTITPSAGTNRPPTATNLSATTQQNTTLKVTLVGSDPDGDALTYAIAGQPRNGTVTLVGSVATYIPNTNSSGNDTFTYTVSDGKGGTATATVSITIMAASNVLADASRDFSATQGNNGWTYGSYTTNTSTTFIRAETYSATAVPGGVWWQGSPSNANAVMKDWQHPGVSQPSVRRWTASADGSVVLAGTLAKQDPNGGNGVRGDILVNGVVVWSRTIAFNDTTGGNYSVPVTIKSGDIVDFAVYAVNNHHSYDTTKFSATITAVTPNTPPTASNLSLSTAEDTAKTITLIGSDADGDTLTYALVSPPTKGTVTISGNQATYTPATNFNGSDSFRYSVSDGKGGVATATVNVTVTAVNDPPVAVADQVSTPAGRPVLVNLVANDTDPEGDRLTMTSVGQGANGTASILVGAALYTPKPGFVGTDSFTYTVSDGKGGISTGRATVSVGAGSTALADSAHGFSDTQGKNGWSYGSFTSNTTAAFVAASQFSASNVPGGVWQNPGADNGVFGFGQHPGVNQPSVRRWTASTAGTVQIAGRLAKIDINGGNGVRGDILVNGVVVWSRTLAFNDGLGANYSIPVSLKVGDVVDFAVYSVGNNHSHDTTLLSATITAAANTSPRSKFSAYTNQVAQARATVMSLLGYDASEARPNSPGEGIRNRATKLIAAAESLLKPATKVSSPPTTIASLPRSNWVDSFGESGTGFVATAQPQLSYTIPTSVVTTAASALDDASLLGVWVA